MYIAPIDMATQKKNQYFADSIRIVADGRYYRVVLTIGTHKLHSEKLNIETAAQLHFELLTGKKS